LERSPQLPIKDGQVQPHNLRSELMTLDDLLSHLRRKGIEDSEKVKHCFLEGDGHVSVVPMECTAQPIQDEDTQQK